MNNFNFPIKTVGKTVIHNLLYKCLGSKIKFLNKKKTWKTYSKQEEYLKNIFVGCLFCCNYKRNHCLQEAKFAFEWFDLSLPEVSCELFAQWCFKFQVCGWSHKAWPRESYWAILACLFCSVFLVYPMVVKYFLGGE